MDENQQTKDATAPRASGDAPQSVSAPTISLPKGGGAMRGIGEKFAANPVTGTGSMTVPIATSPGRTGFGPQLALSYDSGAGNGPFGFGWSLPLPAITRKTDKGLPQYQDGDESDVFLLSGAEDLVPVLIATRAGRWEREPIPPRTVNGNTYHIQRYRPRIEGLLARIERWTNHSNPADSFWRSISKDNITTWYGKTAESRIVDPADTSRIFSWLICESYDDKGNAITYEYKPEDSAGIDLSQAHEQHRTERSRSAQRYLKHIRYGNRLPFLPRYAPDQPPTPLPTEWLFEVVFDYGEHHLDAPRPTDRGVWPVRNDPFSSYRAGFEVRTYRLCQRVLMFHHFPDEPEVGADCLVRSTDFAYSYERDRTNARNPIFSLLCSVTQMGYKRQPAGGYLRKSLPPVELTYSEARLRDEIHEVDPGSVDNLPEGLSGSRYEWVDLDGEGLSGVLTEQADGWLYKRNLSPITHVGADGAARVEPCFAPVERLTTKPAVSLASGQVQLLDLAGNGQLDVVSFRGPTPGFYERTRDEGWEPFLPFSSLPVVEWNDPNLRFVDLTGDGHADILITEDAVFTWYPSLAEAGFGPAERVSQALTEEHGPRLVLTDSAQSIYLADLSGDGLTDLVRIRNGDVCYWPNLGYGRFGAKVTMDDAPWFETPDLFDQRRIRLADIDGSGVTDILYLGRDGVHIFFNQSGNSWSRGTVLAHFPPIDNIASVNVLDLLGIGTACLVWSSPLPGEARRPMRYVDLMSGQKPHLLIKTRNNLGAETVVQYAPSTKFYLADKLAGTPWVTTLPFPVQCVAKVTVTDQWRQTMFSTSYSYHHGYFDGIEREFRGFGRVEQVDVESYGEFTQGNATSPYITDDKTLYQPPVKTVTWFHTGAAIDRERILSQFVHEYFPLWFEALRPTERNVLGAFQEHALPEPDLGESHLTTDEWREALRACKGMTLRQEVYELDVDALEDGEHRRVRLFSAATHNCHIQRLQEQATNRHAVFLVTESEAITYHYELDLRQTSLQPDPRIAHTLNLKVDGYGHVLQSAAVTYPRIEQFADASLSPQALRRTREVQAERHLAYTETRYTNDVADPDNYRPRVPCEVLSYELTGINPERLPYFTFEELRRYRLSEVHQATGTPVAPIPYHQLTRGTSPRKRCVEHVRMLFFDQNLRDPLPFGMLNAPGLPYETYTLALTEDLLHRIFADKLTPAVRRTLHDATISGYLSGLDLAHRFPGLDTTDQSWRRSGIAGFAPDAADHFYVPERYTDPFGNVTTLTYDPLDLFVASSTDALGNTTRVIRFDFRVLAPRELQDPNDNRAEVYFDVLGLPTAMAVKGKGDEGDNLTGFGDILANPDLTALTSFSTAPVYDEAQARQWLGNATARHIYHFGEVRKADGSITWGTQPACACGILRERHVSRLAAGERSPLQAAFEYFDGMGSVLVKKVQAEPVEEGGPLRWIASGKTILNNKGKPVKQYEPYFSESGHRFEEPRENGVTPVLYYDAAGRTIRTEAPDGSHSRVEFSPWHVATYDQNDTVLEPGNAWYARKSAATASAQDQRAARLAAEHAGTPALTLLDSLGRDVVAIAYNRIQDDAGTLQPEKYLTFTKLDAEGKPLWIRDARGNLVMQYITPSVPNNQAADPVGGFAPCYDIVGNLLFQHSMDAGDCWMFNDAAGKPMLAWDFNERQDDMGTTISEQRVFFTRYDRLHRPTEIWLTVNAALPQLIERFVYGEALSHSDEEIAEAKRLNLRGQLHEHYDMSGLVTHLRHDFKGNLLEAQRTLASTYQAPVIDWSAGSPTNGLESETFTQLTEYDALNRTTRQYNWHKVMPDSRVAVYEPRYNARGLLVGEDLVIRATKKPNGYEGGQRTTAIVAIAYDAKGQKERIEYGNRTTTRYHYDPETFRLQQLRTTRPGYNPRFPEHRSGLSDDRVLQQLSYTYDPVGNITEIYDEAYEPVFFANQRVEPQSRYTYDALYRLLEATGRENATAVGSPPHMQNTADHIGEFPIPGPGALRNYTQRYQYDAVGNIERMQHLGVPTGSWTRLYTYADDSNRLLRTWAGADRWEDTTATNKVTYGYDTHGSMLNLTDTGEEFRLSWDYRDMIHTVNLGGGGRAYYNYDVGKDRTRKVIIGETGNNRWERLYLSGVEVYRRFVAGEMTEEIETHHLFVGEQRALIVEDVLATNNTDLGRGPRFRYQYNNHLGSACMELDDAAAVITYEEYHPYGTTAYFAGRSAAEVSLKRYRYTGKERDGETGLHYHSARYYTPWLGRWTSCDPAQYIDGPNLYLYCNNNPVRYFDPNGRDPIPIIVPGSPSGPPLGGGGAITLPGTQPGTYEWRQPPRPSPPQGLRIGAGVAGVAGAATLIVAVAVAGAVLLFTGLGGNRYSDREMIRRHFAEEQRHPISVPPPHPTSIAVDPRQQQPAQAPPQAPPARVEDPTIHPPVVDPRPVVPHLATTSLPDRARRAVQLLYGPASADAQAWLARMEQRSGRGGSAAIGPVLSMVRDPRAPRGNSIFIGLNTGLPPDLHPILAQRLRGVLERRARGEVTVRNTNAPGSHAEFNAFNQAIHAREARERRTITEADLSEFEMHNVWLQPQQRLQAAPRCDVCGPVTQDISITPELAEAERALAAQLAAGLGRQR